MSFVGIHILLIIMLILTYLFSWYVFFIFAVALHLGGKHYSGVSGKLFLKLSKYAR